MADVVTIFKRLKKGLLPSTESDKPETINFLFRLYTKLTPVILIIFSALVFLQQFFREHMKCILPPDEDVRQSALNQYCFITGTYTVPSLYNSPKMSVYVGVGPHVKGQDEQKFHHYFQWVPFLLFLQGMALYLPDFVWKSIESGRLKSYVYFTTEDGGFSLKCRQLMQPDGPTQAASIQRSNVYLDNAGMYFVRSLGFNKSYSLGFVFCEILNLGVVLISFMATNWFLQGDFQDLGLDWVRYLNQLNMKGSAKNATEDKIPKLINPVDKAFPKMSKCEFKKFGVSGSTVNYDLLCVMSLNVLNEKIYLFIWFWFGILFLLSGVNAVYRAILFLFPMARNGLILKRVGIGANFINTRNRLQGSRNDAKDVFKHLGYSDWFLLKRISDNLSRSRFADLCSAIKRAMDKSEDNAYTTDDANYQGLMRRSKVLFGNGKKDSHFSENDIHSLEEVESFSH